jgi:hypothetical protein
MVFRTPESPARVADQGIDEMNVSLIGHGFLLPSSTAGVCAFRADRSYFIRCQVRISEPGKGRLSISDRVRRRIRRIVAKVKGVAKGLHLGLRTEDRHAAKKFF